MSVASLISPSIDAVIERKFLLVNQIKKRWQLAELKTLASRKPLHVRGTEPHPVTIGHVQSRAWSLEFPSFHLRPKLYCSVWCQQAFC